MKRIVPLAIFIFLSFTTLLAQQPAAVHPESGTWVSVAQPDGGFSIMMPAKPADQVEPVEGHPGITNHFLTLETDLAGYVVSNIQFPDEITDPAVIKTMLDQGREGGLKTSGGELKSETEIELRGYLGREWSVQLPGGLLATERTYWVKQRLFQTIFVAILKETDTPELTKLRQQAATRFLDSFTLSDAAGK